ncbi:FCD domain-containing protein [Candidatus Phyllobacterium onerii]|uniref:FCD domain-containing protein n=1 Tax=Candidatus Phyllobacterium onerii TaxID=3020828 RepID=UPI003A84D80C
MCVRLAAYRMTPLGRSHLIELHDASEQLVVRGDFHACDAFNLKFHEGIYRATHNGFLAEQAIAVAR